MIDDNASRAFAALGHPNRVAILRLLVRAGDDGLSVSQMRAHLDIPATTFGHHLKAMAEAGLVLQTKQSRSLISRADYSALQTLINFLMEDCCQGVLSSPSPLELEPS